MGKTLDRFLVICYINGLTTQLILMAVPLWFTIILSFDAPTFSTNQSYSYMHELMTEDHWAMLSGVCAVAGIGLYCMKTYSARIASNGILAFWHGFVALCVYIPNHYGVDSGVFAILAVGSGLRLAAITNAYRKNLQVATY